VAPEPQTPRGRLTEARLLYSEHAVQSALDVVVDSMDTAEAARPDLVIDMMLLKAQLSYLLSRPIDASVALEAACELAAAEDIRQPFIVSGTALRPIMREHLGRGTAHRAFISDLLSLQAEAHPASQSRSQVAEPLTQRERRVLWYLPSRLSNTEIAADMYVSLNTVKTHIKNVYRKLGVNGRREAVARARQLNLL
jgi:LuxR family maltose regulon positive regulatory protein